MTSGIPGVGCFVFTVEDNGIGMTPEFLERVFAPFERAEDSRMSQATGTGLGLAITKSIVDMMEGDIYVESEKDMGSRLQWNFHLNCQNCRCRNYRIWPAILF